MVFSCNRHEATVGSGLHLTDESFALQGDRRNEHLRLIQQRSHVVREAPRETFHLPDFVDNNEPGLSVPEVKFSQELVEPGEIHSIAADTVRPGVLDVGQDQLATAERHEPKAFSGSPRVPDFFRIEPRRVIVRKTLREFTNHRGLADSRLSGNQNVGCIASVIQSVPAPTYAPAKRSLHLPRKFAIMAY